jgi:hypothetical protein
MEEIQNRYDKMPEYITSVFNVFQMTNKKAEAQNDRRIKLICLTIYNYVLFMSKQYQIDLKNITEPENINLIPIFEYISVNDIEFFDFSNIKINDIDVTKKEDLERFVLTHLYYITQNKKL